MMTKLLLRAVSALSVIVFAASSAQAILITSFENLDFDAGVANVSDFHGFDSPVDIPGWTDYPASPLNDAGVEGPDAWWSPYDDHAGFMSSGDAAYTMSTYTIQAGDVYQISYYAQQWSWTGDVGEWTATLFYDDPANVIGTFTQSDLPGSWTEFSDPTGIAATPASVGGTLGILMTSTGSRIAQVDEITVNINEGISLVVNSNTGEARLRNDTDSAISFDYYRIDSPDDGALLTADYNGTTGWDSLSDQGIDAVDDGLDLGETWTEATAANSANRLVENFLLGSTTLDPNAYVPIGAPINTSLLGSDLGFYFAAVGESLTRTSIVYVTDFGGLDGDYNDDGTIDAADYTVWRDAMAAGATELTNDSTPGTVDESDYTYWKAHFGETAGAGATLGTALVPEPASALLLLLALVGGSALVRRR